MKNFIIHFKHDLVITKIYLIVSQFILNNFLFNFQMLQFIN
jgi:hypothetical protein